MKERSGIERTGAILSPCSASANPAQMTAGLLKAAQQGGVEIVSPLAITAIRETRDGVMVATADGTLLCAADLIACTGYEYLKMMESPLHQVISTWAIASEPNAQRPDWLDDHLVWEASEPISISAPHPMAGSLLVAKMRTIRSPTRTRSKRGANSRRSGKS